MATKVTLSGLMDLMDKSTYKQIGKLAADPTTTALVLYENNNLSSSSMGERTVMVVGKGRTYSDLKTALAGHLGDLPSRRQYPAYYWEKE